MKERVAIMLLLLIPIFGMAQDSVLARLIFFGDAGEINIQQSTLIKDASSKVLKGKTIVMFLGDNIYPKGMGLPDSKDELRTQKILQSQFEPMRAAGASVYFVPGNHDWDRMGPEGLSKIKAQWKFLQSQSDSLLKLVPENGCPDPTVIPVTDSLIIIAMDSEWWLFPYDKNNEGAECDCSSTRDIVAALREILFKNQNKTIILAMHHPFHSYGVHGGRFSWKAHIFPLTAVNPKLYIPLPVIGSIYPFYRNTFPNYEDLKNPLYKEMINDVEQVFNGFPNLILASGHDHGLQLINIPQKHLLQIVSGGGSKHTTVGKGKYSLFGAADQGYVIADVLNDRTIRLNFYKYSDGKILKAFDYDWHKQSVQEKKDSMYHEIKEDSIIVEAHPAYNKVGGFARIWFGNNYRKAWATPVKLPVLHISELEGGLLPEKLGGGFQSTTLRMKNSTGKEYILRTVEKSPDKVLPLQFQGTFARQLIDDATSAQHPYFSIGGTTYCKCIGRASFQSRYRRGGT